MESDGSPPKKVRIKAGNFEFEAEGSIDDYREVFERFMVAVEKLSDRPIGTAPTPALPMAATVGPATSSVNSSDQPDVVTTNAATPIGEDVIGRLYRRDGDGISLLALPRSDDGGADAVIALLYGFQRLLNRQAVTGVALMRAAKQSGINIPRVDTTMARRQDFVLVAGSHRGRVYSLNNRGVIYAEGVLRRTLE